MPLIIFCALKYVLSCYVFILEPEAPPSSTMFFLKALGKFVIAFFLLFGVVYISSLVFLTFASGFCGLSF
jgi:hypothetical protein